MTTKGPETYSDLAIPPGETLAEELEVRGMTQKELATRLGRPIQVVNEIIKGKKAITPDTALELSLVLGIEAGFWMNLESRYQLTLARQRNKDFQAAEEQWLSEYPVKEMMERGWIEAGRDKASRVKSLLSFFGVASIKPRVCQEAIGFRITEAARQSTSPGALAVWLRQGEIEAQQIDTAIYDEGRFRDALNEIRGMTELAPKQFLTEVTQLCAGAGVAFCVVQEFPKSGANGAVRWLTDSKALLQMSIRNKWADIFWFSFFHEAGHLLKHRTQRRILIDGLNGESDDEDLEREADLFARDLLIAPEAWSEFCEEGNFAVGDVQKFALSIGIAPFIVVGRLQKEKLIPYSHLASLKKRYEWKRG